MTPGSYLLDTNAAIALLNGDPGLTPATFGQASYFLPVTVVGELYFGAIKGSRTAANLVRLDAFVAPCS